MCLWLFWGLTTNTILAMQNVEFWSVSSDRYPIRRKCQYRSDNDPEYRIGATLVTCLDQRFCPFKPFVDMKNLYFGFVFGKKYTLNVICFDQRCQLSNYLTLKMYVLLCFAFCFVSLSFVFDLFQLFIFGHTREVFVGTHWLELYGQKQLKLSFLCELSL